MRLFSVRCNLALAIVLLLPGTVWAATVRGQLRCNGSGAAGIAVTLYNERLGQVASFVTGGDGMFYFNVPPGHYQVQLWYSRRSRTPDETFPIEVTAPSTDIPRHHVPVCSPK